jgi:hypothetical protein
VRVPGPFPPLERAGFHEPQGNASAAHPFDSLIVLGMVRDRYVDGRINRVYLYALPPMIVLQSLAVYAWRANPAWWQAITRAIL